MREMKSQVWTGILRKQDLEKSLKDGMYKGEKLLREREGNLGLKMIKCRLRRQSSWLSACKHENPS